MATIEQVDKLRTRADVSFEEAKAALEACGGDLLDAVIYLEKQGKVKSPDAGGYYSSNDGARPQEDGRAAHTESAPRGDDTLGGVMRKLWRFIVNTVRTGNRNHFEVTRHGDAVISIPVTALVLLILFCFWVAIPLLVVGLFFGYHYGFRGRELGRDSVNKVMDDASHVVEDLKKSFGGDERQSL